MTRKNRKRTNKQTNKKKKKKKKKKRKKKKKKKNSYDDVTTNSDRHLKRTNPFPRTLYVIKIFVEKNS